MEAVILAVGALSAVLGAAALAKKTRIGAPLLLVALGMGVSLLPFVPEIEVEPEWILGGVLPPLLYSSAVRTPLVDLRRNVGVIGGLSVALVLATAVAVGIAVHAVFPAVPLHVAVALGAVVSPTDAAATAIVKGAGAPARVATVLDGEALLNDATSLVTLRTAIAGAVTLGGALGDFLWAVGAATTVGLAVGWLSLRVAARIEDPVIHTLFSFLVPFVAYLPVESLGASGLASVVVAGLVAGQGAHRFVSARNRLAQRSNWQTVEVIAEGAVFLAMGLQVFALHQEFQRESDSLGGALLTAGVALAAVLAVRGLFVAVLLGVPRSRVHSEPAAGPVDPESAALGWREGLALEWAGLRGVVTLAAAQTLPLDTPERPALVLIAFAVATASLMVQGLTLPVAMRALHLTTPAAAALTEWRVRLRRRLGRAARTFLEDEGPALVRPNGRSYSRPALTLALSTAPWVTVPDVDEPAAASQAGVDFPSRSASPTGTGSQSVPPGSDPLSVRDSVTPAPGRGTEPSVKALRREELRELRLATVRAMRRDLLATGGSDRFPSSVLEEGFDDLDREELAIDVAPDR